MTFVFNVALGRVTGFYDRVRSNDPANSALVLVALASTGLETDAVLRDKDTLADVLSGTTNEATNVNYARKILTDAELAAWSPDDANDRIDLALPLVSWTPGPQAGDNWGMILVCYDPDTTVAGDDTIIPLTGHTVAITPDGNTVATNAGTYYRATG